MPRAPERHCTSPGEIGEGGIEGGEFLQQFQRIENDMGARRIGSLTMRTMTLLERDISRGDASVGALLDGATVRAGSPGFSVAKAIEALAVEGWPDNLDLTPQDALEANMDYLDLVVHTQEHRIVYLVRRDRIDFLQARYHYQLPALCHRAVS